MNEERELKKEEILELLTKSLNNNHSYAITTFDNPFNPFTQFNSWFLFDIEKGYNTCQYLSRIANTSNQFSEYENDEEIERAIDEIIKYDFRNIYKKVKNSDFN